MPPHQLGPEQTEARDRKILRLWNDGLNTPALSSRFGVSGSKVSKILSDARERGEAVRVADNQKGRNP